MFFGSSGVAAAAPCDDEGEKNDDYARQRGQFRAGHHELLSLSSCSTGDDQARPSRGGSIPVIHIPKQL